jgi:uncharacterized membrane protein YesL
VSRAEPLRVPRAPRLGSVLRSAASDLYFHGVRLIVINVVWGLAALLTAYLLLRSPLGLVALVALIPLTAGLAGMAARVVRERSIVMSDAWDAIRTRFWVHLAVGIAQIVVGVVAYVDLLLGIRLGGILGLILAVIALETLIALWLLTVSTWPILLDPLRASEPTRAKLRLGALLLVAHPMRIGGMAVAIGLFLIASIILAAAIVTVSGAFAFLVAAHWVLPAADRLEGRPTLDVDA